jgi:hypothetical protein
MSNSNQTAGIGLGTLVFIVFLFLKLAEIGPVANWSWWAVTSPLWLPLLVILTIVGVLGLLYIISNQFNK